MTTWPQQTPRPESQSHIAMGVLIALAVIGAAIALVTLLDRRSDGRDDADLRDAIAELHDARVGMQASADELRSATATLQEAARTFERRATTVNILDMVAPPPPSSALPAPAAPSDGATYSVRCTSPGRCTMPRAELEPLLADPAGFLRMARIMPSIKDGVPRGFKVYGVRPTSLLGSIGVKNGDLITAINGEHLDSIDTATKAFAELRTSALLMLSCERKGEQMLLTLGLE